MARRKTKVSQDTIARALRAARTAGLPIASFTICEETGLVRVYTATSTEVPKDEREIDDVVRNWE